MDNGNGSQSLWATARKVSPNGNGYNWNYMTIDGYLNYEDLLEPKWKASTKFPKELKVMVRVQHQNYKTML